MADDFQSLKVASQEQSSSSKFDNFVQAVEDAINSLDNSNIAAGAAIAASKLAPGSNGDVMTTTGGVAVWAAGTGTGYALTLPGAPSNGQEAILVDSLTAPTYAWRFRYNSSKASNKWDFIGGSELYAEVTTNESPSGSGSYVALATAGPSVTLPVAGDYQVKIGARITTSAAASAFMSYDIGGTGAVDGDSLQHQGVDSTEAGSYQRSRKKAGLTAITLTAKYKGSTTNPAFADRWISVIPIAVGG